MGEGATSLAKPPSDKPAGGIDLTADIYRRTTQLQAIMYSKGVDMNEATAFVPTAYLEVIERYKKDHKPGMILADNDRIWWIDRTHLNLEKTLDGVQESIREMIARMLARSNPRSEVMIIRRDRSKHTIEPFLVKEGGKVDAPGVYRVASGELIDPAPAEKATE